LAEAQIVHYSAINITRRTLCRSSIATRPVMSRTPILQCRWREIREITRCTSKQCNAGFARIRHLRVFLAT